MQCGKVVFTDIHIQKSVGNTGGDDSDPDKPFPSGCKTNAMSPQAKALEFLFFDLSACVEPPTAMPQPPIVPPPGTTMQPPPPVGRPPALPPPPPPPPPPIRDSLLSRGRAGRAACVAVPTSLKLERRDQIAMAIEFI